MDPSLGRSDVPFPSPQGSKSAFAHTSTLLLQVLLGGRIITGLFFGSTLHNGLLFPWRGVVVIALAILFFLPRFCVYYTIIIHLMLSVLCCIPHMHS